MTGMARTAQEVVVALEVADPALMALAVVVVRMAVVGVVQVGKAV